MKMINLSGHPVEQEGIEIVFAAQIPNIDLANPREIVALAIKLAEQVKPFVLEGIPVALPGMGCLAAHTLAEIHGRYGYWPKIAWAARVDGKFVWSEEFTSDLHEIRTAAREGRDWAVGKRRAVGSRQEEGSRQ